MPVKRLRVSYLISTKNRAEYLDKTLKNVREFITPDDELIIFDGSSTDDTHAVVERHKDIVTFFKSENDFGEAHGFNKGILHSSGEYIKFLTDDDYFFPQAMRDACAILAQNAEIDALICGGESYVFDPNSGDANFQYYLWLPPSRSLANDLDSILHYAACGLGLFVKRETIARVGLLDTSFRAIDTDYLSRLVLSGVNFKYLDVKLFRRVEYPHSGKNFKSECTRDAIRVIMRHRDWNRLAKYDLEDVAKVMGSDHVTNAMPFLHLMKTANSLRYSKAPFIQIISMLARIFQSSRSLAWRIARVWNGGSHKRVSPIELEIPSWSGKLYK